MRGVLSIGAALTALVLGGAAQAADLAPVYKAAKAVVAPPPYGWTGCYIGAHAGGGWGEKHWANVSGLDEGTSDIGGPLAGGQVGCDYQTGAWLFGAEGTASWTDLAGEHRDPVLQFNNQVLHSEVDWLATLTGRVGYVFDRFLLYAKGGGAWAGDKFWDVADGVGTIATASETRSGWTVGGGAEYGFAPRWSAKLEYDYLDFGTNRVRLDCPGCMAGFFNKDITQHIHVVKVGVNYRFGWIP
jgi:outer membrane immunogenic protein